MNQDDYRNRYKQINSSWQDSVSIYKKLVRENINENTTVLEAGVGFSDMFAQEYELAQRVIGVDVNKDYLAWNKTLDEKHVAPLENMSMIDNNSVDLVISSWVLEHVEDAEQVFAEINRVLKPGGKFIFLTPNAWKYVVIGNQLINDKIRNFLARRLTAELTVDPMPAFYKANTVNKITKLAGQNALQKEELILNGDPTYMAFNKVFFWIGILIELILFLPLIRNTKVHIIGVFKKPM